MSSLCLHVRAGKSPRFPFHHDRIMTVSGSLPRGTPSELAGRAVRQDDVGWRELVGQLRPASQRDQGLSNSYALVVWIDAAGGGGASGRA
jgi:hypothetical protein